MFQALGSRPAFSLHVRLGLNEPTVRGIDVCVLGHGACGWGDCYASGMCGVQLCGKGICGGVEMKWVERCRV